MSEAAEAVEVEVLSPHDTAPDTKPGAKQKKLTTVKAVAPAISEQPLKEPSLQTGEQVPATPNKAAQEPTKQDSSTANKKNSRPKRQARPSRDEIIRQQSNPSTRLAGRQKTLTLPFQYTSDIMHEYIQLNQSKMLDAYERLAALLRMLVNSAELHKEVKDWINTNTKIADVQLTELTNQRLAILEQAGDVDFPKIKIPEDYHTEFEASHPIANLMIATLQRVDVELNECEKLYMALLIDDIEYRQLFNQATNVIRGSVDRIFKATNPGKRKENGRYSPGQLAAWIREGNKLIFADVPQNLKYLIDGDN